MKTLAQNCQASIGDLMTSRAHTARLSKISRKPQPIACKHCSVMVEPIWIGGKIGERAVGKWFTRDICQSCQDTQQQTAEKRAGFARVRQRRAETSNRIGRQLKHYVPPLYAHARMGHLSIELQKDVSCDESIFLWGRCGSGKTYAAMAAIRAGAIAGQSVAAAGFDDLLAELRRFEKQEQDVLADYLDADVLLLDDIGQTGTDYAIRILFRIIDHRLRNVKKTIITANLSPTAIGKILGERIFSRLKTYRIVNLKSSDKRGNR